MLELKNIKKTYHVGEIETKALDDISVAFRQKEFVAILGKSGSGKTTCLNIIGGLDRYDTGELIIKGKRTSDFSDKDWDAYRNNSIGFVFQSYNLIMHLSIVANVELGMTLSGVSSDEKHKRAIDVLKQVGLEDHLHKKPNQLSGGQMQRVAIARALTNDPEILLCDEPTGALDSVTSEQIMDLIREVSHDRLVIMVTHNPEIAEKYADRIIKFSDGKIISDTHPHVERPKEDQFNLIKTSMSFLTALRLSFNNIMTKKGRTFLTAFASSIGIIGIAVILSLSTGFQTQIDQFQSDALSEFPILISQNAASVDPEEMSAMMEDISSSLYPDTDFVEVVDSSKNAVMHTNVFSNEYMDYINAIDPEICSAIGYTRIVGMNLVRKDGEKYVPASLSTVQTGSGASMMSGMSSMGLSSYPEPLVEGEANYLERNYELLYGEYPSADTDLVLVINQRNRLDLSKLSSLGFECEDKEHLLFSDIVGTEYKLISNDDFYTATQYGNYLPTQDYEAMYNSDRSLTLRICGVVRLSEDSSIGLIADGIAYSDKLAQLVIDRASQSSIVKAQRDSDINVITMESIDESEKTQMIAYLGGDPIPFMLMLYPKNFENKDLICDYLDEYNKGKEIDNTVIYTDLAGTMSSLTGGIMDAITIVLIAFAGISLVVSLIMICIITYTSVLERTKEIGVLRALGARKKDITRVFDAETFIIGILSGVIGIIAAMLLTIPINAIIYNLSDLSNVAVLQPLHAVILVIISTLLTMLGGHVPAKMASKKDAVEALRSE